MIGAPLSGAGLAGPAVPRAPAPRGGLERPQRQPPGQASRRTNTANPPR